MKSKSSLFFGLLLLQSTSAWAQTPGSVSSGATEVANEGKEKVAADPAAITDATELSLQGGGLLAGGNSKSFALTTSAKFLLRRSQSEFNAAAAMNYAQSVARNPDGTRGDGAMDPTVENYQGRLRYDYFFDPKLSAFFAVSGRKDRFQQLDLRLGVDPGVSAYAIRTDQLKLWGELGYNLQVDDFTTEGQAARVLADPDANDPLVDHNVRAYLGYQQRLDNRLSLDTGVELFKSVVREEGFRLNFGAQLTTQLIDRFSFAVGVLTLYDNTPVPGVDKLDVQSSLSFVYSLL